MDPEYRAPCARGTIVRCAYVVREPSIGTPRYCVFSITALAIAWIMGLLSLMRRGHDHTQMKEERRHYGCCTNIRTCDPPDRR